MKESDWKAFRAVHVIALERFCERALADIQRVASNNAESSREKYHKIYDLIASRDKELAKTFNGMSRSMALIQLLNMHSLQLLTEENLAAFSPELRKQIENC